MNSRLPSWGFSVRLGTNSDCAPNYDSNHNHAERRGLTVTASTSDRILLLACRKKKSSLKLPLSLKLCRLNKQFSQCTFGSANHPKDLKPKISGGRKSRKTFVGIAELALVAKKDKEKDKEKQELIIIKPNYKVFFQSMKATAGVQNNIITSKSETAMIMILLRKKRIITLRSFRFKYFPSPIRNTLVLW